MAKRSYRQYCGLAKALDVVGQRWTLLIVRNLLLGPLRYTDLLHGLPGITTNLLADRLNEMEDAGLVAKVRMPPPTAVDAYELTQRGRGLEPAVHALGAWGGEYMKKPARGDATDASWGMLALKRRYRGIKQNMVVVIAVGEQTFTLRCSSGGVDVHRARPTARDVEIRGSFKHIRDLLYRGVSLDALVDAEHVRYSGSRKSLKTFLAAFGVR